MKSPRLPMLAGAFAALVLASTANAAPDILPGLWKTKVDISSKSGRYEQAMAQAEQMLASMPQDQQQMMKEMMASRGLGLSFADRTLQACLTQADIERFDLGQTDERCRQNVESLDDNRFRLTLQCDDKGMSGEGEYVVKDEKSYTGTTVLKVNMNGQSETLTMTQEAQWLSSDCGTIQPN